jgi:hypothetical protein
MAFFRKKRREIEGREERKSKDGGLIRGLGEGNRETEA